MAHKMIFSNEKTQAIFNREDCSIAAFSDLMQDVAKNKAIYDADGNEVTSADANSKIRNIMFEVLGIDSESSKKEIRRAIRRHKVDVYEVVEDTIESLLTTGWGENPFFNQFVEQRNIAEGDENQFYTEDKVILTVSQLSGNHHNLFRQRLGEGTSYSIPTSWYGVKIYAEYEQFMAGKVDWAMFIQKVYEAFDKKVNAMIAATLDGVGSKLPAGDQWVKTMALTADTKDKLMQLIEDVQTANSGAEVVIMATKAALGKLTKLADVSWISEDMKKERNTTGRIGMFEGITLYEIPQAFADNDTTKRLVDSNRLLVMPLTDNKFIKLINEGEAQVTEVSDGSTNADMTIEYEYQAKLGVGVVINRLFGIFNITA